MDAQLVRAEVDALGKRPHPAAIDVPQDRHQRVVAHFEVPNELLHLEVRLPRVLLPREELPEEGAPGGEHAAVDGDLAEGRGVVRADGDEGVGAEAEVGGVEEGLEVGREEAEGRHFGGARRLRGGSAGIADAAAVVGVGEAHGRVARH